MKAADRPALALGAAACLPDDVAALREMADIDGWLVLAANDGGAWWPGRLDHWCSLHADEMAEREAKRKANGYPDGYRVWHGKHLPAGEALDGATSAFLAVAVAYHLGHRRIVLCGCPMDRQGYAAPHMHHGDGVWPYYATYQRTIPSQAKQHPWLMDCVRSMSGWTAKFFGRPTEEWLRLV
ncbi:MAG TPA: hypothetical protein VKD22_10945 [Ramlibacter sp.]|nr:hypothetical protein [Ramlibacter sp.]